MHLHVHATLQHAIYALALGREGSFVYNLGEFCLRFSIKVVSECIINVSDVVRRPLYDERCSTMSLDCLALGSRRLLEMHGSTEGTVHAQGESGDEDAGAALVAAILFPFPERKGS